MASSLWQVLWQRNKHPTTQWLNATATYLAHGFGGQQFRLGPAKQSFGSGQGSADLGWAHSRVCCHLVGPLGLAAQLASFGMNGLLGLSPCGLSASIVLVWAYSQPRTLCYKALKAAREQASTCKHTSGLCWQLASVSSAKASHVAKPCTRVGGHTQRHRMSRLGTTTAAIYHCLSGPQFPL